MSVHLTDLPCGQLKSTITLRFLDPALGLVSMGEQWRLLNGGVLNGPRMAFLYISTERYLEMHWRADWWFVMTVFGSNSDKKGISMGNHTWESILTDDPCYCVELAPIKECSNQILWEFVYKCNWVRLCDKAAGAFRRNPYLNCNKYLFSKTDQAAEPIIVRIRAIDHVLNTSWRACAQTFTIEITFTINII